MTSPPDYPRFCAHADQHGKGSHWLAAGEVCPATVDESHNGALVPAGHYDRVLSVLDIEDASALVRLVVALADELEVYDPDAGDFDPDRPMHRDLPGGAGLVPLNLDETDLATLREVLSCVADDLGANEPEPTTP
jgi:hypothetical protein